MRVESDLDLDETLHRKSDLDRVEARGITIDHAALFQIFHARPAGRFGEADLLAKVGIGLAAIAFKRGDDFPVELVHAFRSEEHTSELQSLMRISYAVFCLKKKTKDDKQASHIEHIHDISDTSEQFTTVCQQSL